MLLFTNLWSMDYGLQHQRKFPSKHSNLFHRHRHNFFAIVRMRVSAQTRVSFRNAKVNDLNKSSLLWICYAYGEQKHFCILCVYE